LKTPSATKLYPSRPELTFFTDRDLGKQFPHLLRENGVAVESYFDHYESSTIPDHEWIEYTASAGLVALSRDNRIRKDPVAIRAVMENGSRLFIVRGALLAPARAAMVIEALDAVKRVLEQQFPHPFIANIRREALPRGSFHCTAQVMLSYEAWRKQGMAGFTEDGDLLA
jgi:hypothetical protein